MSLVSGGFLLFALTAVALYYALPMRLRPFWLLACSVFFYLTAGLRFAPFLLLSILSTWAAARCLPRVRRKKLLLGSALALNLGLLALLKLLPVVQMRFPAAVRLPLIYPLGIAFYSLQAAGYLIDVYRGKIEAEPRLWRYGLFMSFFPVILQGPISRWDQLSPQLAEGHALDYRNLSFGAQLMLWGYFKKLVIADRAALLVDTVYNAPEAHAGIAVAAAMLLYTLQLYADFSGCVDICRGLSRMLGIELAENFRRPLFSASIREFWRRWHITLGAWLRDYLYIPLGGSRRGEARRRLNVVIVFAVSGFWHGAGFNYLLWGLLHGFYQVVGGMTLAARDRFWRRLGLREPPRLPRQLGCFVLVAFGFHFFRAAGLTVALRMAAACLRGFSFAPLFDGSLLTLGLDGPDLLVLGLSLLLLLLVSRWQEKHDGVLLRERLAALPLPLRWGLWLLGLMTVLIFGIYGPGYSRAQFIYMGF